MVFDISDPALRIRTAQGVNRWHVVGVLWASGSNDHLLHRRESDRRDAIRSCIREHVAGGGRGEFVRLGAGYSLLLAERTAEAEDDRCEEHGDEQIVVAHD